jgi:hypothetical protein
MLSAKQGVSMRQYVTESLCKNVESEEKKHLDLSENKFKKAKEKVFKEHHESLRRLADK